MIIELILTLFLGIFIGYNIGYSKGDDYSYNKNKKLFPLLIKEKSLIEGYCIICGHKEKSKE